MANLLDGMSKSFNAVESGDIDHGRRRFVEVAAISAAAAATLSFLPKHAAAATENSAIRPFRINVSEDQLVDLRRRIARHAMARPGDGQ